MAKELKELKHFHCSRFIEVHAAFVARFKVFEMSFNPEPCQLSGYDPARGNVGNVLVYDCFVIHWPTLCSCHTQIAVLF
jgi:hypothetical protein